MGGVASFRGMRVCFTGRMPMRTPTGHVLASDVRAGMMLNSRDEFDPEGLVVTKLVE